MQLELTIAGLCLLIDDPTDDAVHVLMPTTAGHAPHEIRLLHPAASGRASDVITGYAADFAGLVSVTTGRPAIPSSVLDIARVCAKVGTVPRDVLDFSDASKAGHVTLRGGRVSVLKQECCMIDGKRFSAAGQLRWTTDVVGSSRMLSASALDGKSPKLRIPLHAEHESLQVALVHAEPGQIPATLEDLLLPGMSVFDHFQSFYGLYESSGCTAMPSRCFDAQASSAAFFYPSQCMSMRGTAA